MISRSDSPSAVRSDRLPGVLGGEFGNAPLEPVWLALPWLAVSRGRYVHGRRGLRGGTTLAG
ncbi:hypothetical protein [Nocardia pseudovaccinii]|uniref:hypothetical protein n=1 Tax=Nocardia pseudovaccinii TaxID=189540 RepID=UPI0007A45ADD|nr:hypothetical protein [Nocardia pseudovaccinii]